MSLSILIVYCCSLSLVSCYVYVVYLHIDFSGCYLLPFFRRILFYLKLFRIFLIYEFPCCHLDKFAAYTKLFRLLFDLTWGTVAMEKRAAKSHFSGRLDHDT